MPPCHYADKVLNDRDRYSATIPGLSNCSTAQRLVRTASALGEAIGTGLREAYMKKESVQAVDRRDTAGTLTPHESVLKLQVIFA